MMQRSDKDAKLGVLDGLIKYMRQLELAKDDPKDALGEGLDMVKDEMKDVAERDLDSEDPNVEIEIESPEEEEREMADGEEEMEEGEELSPFQKNMKDYFNNTDRPKVGSSLSFMVETKKPIAKSGMKSSSERKDGMDMLEEKMNKKKRGRPFKR
jgi:hypothetical protein